MVEVQDVVVRFGAKTVLNEVSVSAGKGEIVVIMGSSGGGKTTLLKAIAGLLVPVSGKVQVAGVDVVKSPEEARDKMGLVFQYAALFDYLNVEDNILFGVRRQKRLKPADEKEILEGLLEEIGLSGTEYLMPDELSGGMRKRVGLARALCMEPDVLLYDEPTSGLDPVTAYSIDQLIVETRDRLGLTSLVVSHDVSSVFRVADRIVFLHQGEVLFNGSPDAFRGSEEEQLRELVGKAGAQDLSVFE